MRLIRKYYQIVLVILFFLLVLIISSKHPLDPDFYFHVISGDIIAHQGLIHHDVLSQAAGRSWLPYEWLFQLILYWYISVFGFASWGIFTGILGVLQLAALYLLLRRILNLNVIFSLILSLLYFFINIQYITQRPQIIASTFLIIELFILLLYILKNKNVLYLLLPLTYIWANIHASVVLSPFLCFAYFVVCIMNSYLSKNEEALWLRKAKVLGLSTIGVGIVSILPPQGFIPYQYVLLLVNYRHIVTLLIFEWKPLIMFFGDFILYSCVAGIPLLLFLFVIIKKKMAAGLTWVFPLLLFIPYGYTALRNTYYGHLSSILITGWLFSQIKFSRSSRIIPTLVCVGIITVLGIALRVMQVNFESATTDFPEKAADFIHREHMKGNMFNQFGVGGYLAYRLYPEQKVFIDGRADVYLCCEMADYLTLEKNLMVSDAYGYRNLLNEFFNKYHTSYVILVMNHEGLVYVTSPTLLNDPQWGLVYWDDKNEIFVKKDGRNAGILKQFTANAATPFEAEAYKKGHMAEAYDDYVRMTQIQDSALSENAIGLILMQQGKLNQASEQFLKAIQLNKSFPSAYYNMGELLMKEEQPREAIGFYKQALTLSPDQIIMYARLGQAYEAILDDVHARDVWQQGYNHAETDDQRQIFTQLMQGMQENK